MDVFIAFEPLKKLSSIKINQIDFCLAFLKAKLSLTILNFLIKNLNG